MRPPDNYEFCESSCTPTPLTTVYTPPVSCTDNWTPVASYSLDGGLGMALTRNTTADACVPTQWISSCTDCSGNEGLSNISPGVCPEGAQAASTAIVANVTTHYCCPFPSATYNRQYSLSSARCYQTFSGVKTLSYNSTIHGTMGSYVTYTVSATVYSSYSRWNIQSVTAVVNTIFLKRGTLAAEPFIVRFEEEDFQPSKTSSTRSTSQSTATHSDIATTDSNPVETGTPGTAVANLAEAELSTGAKAGIGVGATLGALILLAIGLGIYFIRRKKKRRNDEKATGVPLWNSEVVQAPSELPTKWSTAELDNQPMAPREMPGSRYREVNPENPAELGDVSMSER